MEDKGHIKNFLLAVFHDANACHPCQKFLLDTLQSLKGKHIIKAESITYTFPIFYNKDTVNNKS